MLWMEWVVAGIGIMYFATSFGYLRSDQTGFAMMYMGYALANLGLILAATNGRLP